MSTTILPAAWGPPAERRWWALAVVVAAQFMFVVDAFVVNVAIPTIRRDLGASAGEMEAVLALYQVAYAACVITGSRLGDIHGRRRVFVAGVLAFTATSVWCGLAGSGTELVVARVAQGAAAALMVPQVLATIHALFPDAGRGRAFAVFGIALGLGGAVGFAAGGWLVTLDLGGLGWRAIFLVNLPVGLAVAAAAWRLMPVGETRPGMRLDIGGAALLFLALLCLIGPLLAGHELGWPWWLWLILADGAVLLWAFLRLERRVQRHGGLPLIDLALLGNRGFVRGLSTAFGFHFGNVSFYLLMTFFMQNGLGFSPARSGLAVVPLAVAFTWASHKAGGWVGTYGLRVLLIGCLIQLLGVAALLDLSMTTPPPGMAALVLVLPVFGFGQGLVMAPLAGFVLGRVQAGQAGSAAGMLNTTQQGANAVGIAVVGAVYALGGTPAALVLLGGSVLATGTLLTWTARAPQGNAPQGNAPQGNASRGGASQGGAGGRA
ncbi:MFS transporter [Rhodopila sp.]|uniref:MFS transporter n=1 Tax=Rhodopila sp. TaxID=2480087 RepID=UPI002C57AA0E|nr:MFS transporter [Rhodopila sp.]HVZ07568.1 MFS transporter [Rhodopila sp.]